MIAGAWGAPQVLGRWEAQSEELRKMSTITASRERQKPGSGWCGCRSDSGPKHAWHGAKQKQSKASRQQAGRTGPVDEATCTSYCTWFLEGVVESRFDVSMELGMKKVSRTPGRCYRNGAAHTSYIVSTLSVRSRLLIRLQAGWHLAPGSPGSCGPLGVGTRPSCSQPLSCRGPPQPMGRFHF